MLMKLIAVSLANRLLVLMLAGLLIVAAGLIVPRTPVDVFPELNAPTVVVMAEAGGLAADEVEQFVTFPIETAVSGLPGIRRIRSGSAISLSIVYVEFDWGTEIFQARQLVAERLSGIRERIPEGVHVELAPVTGILGEIMLLALSSPDGRVDDLSLREYAEFELRNRLLSVAGVAQVSVMGGELPEFAVQVRQERLRLLGLTIEDVVRAARGADSTAPAGFLAHVDGRELPVRQMARVRSKADIENTIVAYRDGAAITIGQVAEVTLAGAPRRGTAAKGGSPAVVLSVLKSPEMNTLALTAEVDRVLDGLEPGLPPGMVLDRHVVRQSDFIERAVGNVLSVLQEAAIFVAIVIVLFLLNVRATVITLTALPLSLGLALLLLWAWGLSINVMTLGGLAVAIGELVDDAIIDVENVFRRLRENLALPEADRRPTLLVIQDASTEVRSSVVFASVIICAVFLPLLFLQGIEGRFFQPLGIAYIVSIFASLLVALTVTPALCAYLLRGRLGRHNREGFLVRWIKAAYAPSLRLALRLKAAVLAGAVVATGLSLWLASTFGSSFLPEFNEGAFSVFVFMPPGTSLQESDRVAGNIDRRLAAIEGVAAVVRRTGRAERDPHAEPVSNSEIDVRIRPGFARYEVRRRIDEVLAQFPTVTTMVGQPIEHRLSHVLSGTPAAIAIKVFGDDLDRLRRIAREVEAALLEIPGTRDVAANREVLITSLPVRYRHEDLRHAGLTPASAAEQVRAALYGTKVAEINAGLRRYDLVVRLAPDERDSIQDVRDLILTGAGGARVRLEEVADIGPETASNLIARENSRRNAVISANVAEGYNLGDLIAAVRARVDPIVHAHGYSVQYGGQFEAQQSAARTLYLVGGIVTLLILVLLQMALRTFRAALLVMVNLPLALIGGVAAVFISESPSPWSNLLGLFGFGPYQAPVISIASMIGFITLFGIAVRNGILLVNHYRHLIEHENCSVDQAVLRGSMERLAPILMTALTAVLGLVPMALAGDAPGSELLAPLAVVVLGGLVSSTFLNLIVVPVGYTLVFGTRVPGEPMRAELPGATVVAAPSSVTPS